MASTLEEARLAKEKISDLILQSHELRSAQPSLGIGSADEGYFVRVGFVNPTGAADQLPPDVDGVPVKVHVTGPIRAL